MKTNGLFILHPEAADRIYSDDVQEQIRGLISIKAPVQTPDIAIRDPGLLEDVDVILSGWGAPKLDESFLEAAPNLKAFFYGAGSIRSFVTDAFWARDIPVCSAVGANAIPVAEYSLSQILFCLKSGWQLNARCKNPANPRHGGWKEFFQMSPAGGYKSTVGLISMGTIARIVRRFLKCMDINVIVYDPFTSEEEARELDIELCSLEEVFARANVVSVHTPDLPATQGLITGKHLASMPASSSIINSARSAVIRHSEMIEVLKQRPDMWAVLDVSEIATDDEYRRLQELPNVYLTPHIAGSMGPECARMGQFMADDLKRFLAGEPLLHQIHRERAAIMA